MGYKSESTPFSFEDIAFSCGCIIFAATAIEADLQAVTFMTITFMTQKNGVRGENIGHKAYGDPLLCSKAALLCRFLNLSSNKAPLHSPSPRRDANRNMEEYNANHDLQYPQNLRYVLRPKPGIPSRGNMHLFPPCCRRH